MQINVLVNNQVEIVTVSDGDLVLQDDLFVSTNAAKSIISNLPAMNLPTNFAPIISINPVMQLKVTEIESNVPFTGNIVTANDPLNGECDCGITCGQELSYIEVKNEF